jgi:arylsulfatase A-like enzyme
MLNCHPCIGEFENTLIMFISDNGASSEGGPTGSVNENKFFNNVKDSLEQNLKMIDELGGPTTFNHYAWGWTHAGNTPFRRWKHETYRGGISDPFVVHWPKGIKAKGQVRTQYAHAIDMVPTLLEALGIEAPTSIKGVTQSPIEGLSFAQPAAVRGYRRRVSGRHVRQQEWPARVLESDSEGKSPASRFPVALRAAPTDAAISALFPGAMHETFHSGLVARVDVGGCVHQ